MLTKIKDQFIVDLKLIESISIDSDFNVSFRLSIGECFSFPHPTYEKALEEINRIDEIIRNSPHF